jgi:hypothetical protein
MFSLLKSLIGSKTPQSANDLSWYLAQDPKKRVRQVVLCLPPKALSPSQFQVLMLGQKYGTLLTSDWTTGFFRLDGKPGPFLMIRARNEYGLASQHPTRLAFSFYKMRTAGIAALFWDCPNAVGKWQYGHVEGASTTDQPMGLEILRDAMNKQNLTITFAVHSNRMTGDFGGQQVSIPEAVGDWEIELPEAFRKQVLQEIEDIQKYHKTLNQVSSKEAMNQMWADNPVERTAILPR